MDSAAWLSSVFGMVSPALLAPRDGSSFVSDRSSVGMSPTCPVPKWPRSYLANQERCVGCNPAGAWSSCLTVTL